MKKIGTFTPYKKPHCKKCGCILVEETETENMIGANDLPIGFTIISTGNYLCNNCGIIYR